MKKIFSHNETGLNVTFERDILLKAYCQANSIEWIQEINNGVFRGLKQKELDKKMARPYEITCCII